MQKQTTTKQLQQAVRNNLLIIEKAERYSKTTHEGEEIPADTFRESLDFLRETLFADAVRWHYEKKLKTDHYETECFRMSPHSDIIVIAHLCAKDGVSDKDIEEALAFEED